MSTGIWNEKASSTSASSNGTDSRSIKTLSRNALYSPLVAYEQTQIDPVLYMGEQLQKNTPAAIKESSLTSFFQKVGEDYHRNRARGPDPKNNGSRPLSVTDMDDRLRQKVVTLIGGGVNSSVTSLNKQQTNKAPKGRKRPRRTWEQVESIVSKTKNQSQSQSSMTSVQFLQQFNARWNLYMRQVLNIVDSSKTTSMLDIQMIKGRMVALRKSIELTGAHVQVRTCIQKRNLVGKFGILIGESTNTWSVAMRLSGRRAKRQQRRDLSEKDTASECNETDPVREKRVTEIVSIPKRGSSLDMIIPIGLQTGKGNEVDTESDDEWIVPHQASKSIFITLGGS